MLNKGWWNTLFERSPGTGRSSRKQRKRACQHLQRKDLRVETLEQRIVLSHAPLVEFAFDDTSDQVSVAAVEDLVAAAAGGHVPYIASTGTAPLFTETQGDGSLPTLEIVEAHPDHITGINHQNQLVSVGIPLQEGSGITSVSQLGLQETTEVQFRALSHYPNGEIRWLDIDFLADVSAGGISLVQLIELTTPPSSNDLAQATASGVTVDTGAAQFVIDENSSSLLSSVIVGGVQQLAGSMIVYSIKNGEEYTSAEDSNTEVSIEENGLVTTVVKVEGRLKKADGTGHLWYTARLHFVKGSSDVRTELTFRNASNQVLTAQSYDGYGVRFDIVNPNPTVTFVTEGGQSFQDTLSVGESALIYQGLADNHPLNQREDQLHSCYLWEPTTAGTCSTDGLFEYTYDPAYKGTRVEIAGNVLLQGGNSHSVSHAKVASGNQTISLAQRWMTNYFPASFEIDASGRVDIGLHSQYSGKSNQDFNWGGYVTREFTVAFDNTDAAEVRQNLDWPLVARVNDFDYYRDANALFGENRIVSYSEQESYFAKYNTVESGNTKETSTPEFKVLRFTHWRRHYTDHARDAVDFWRGGSPLYMARFLQLTDYESDAAIVHSDDFDLAESTSLVLPGANDRGIAKYDAGHQLTRYLPLAYHLTGNESLLDAITDYGEDQLYDERVNYFPFPETEFYRPWMRRIENFSWLYQFTGDNRYLSEVKDGIDLLIGGVSTENDPHARGQDQSRGFLNMALGIINYGNKRVVHSFFGGQIAGEAYYHVLRSLRQSGIEYKTEDLEDVVLGHAYFLFREAMRNEDGTASGLAENDYFPDVSNPTKDLTGSVYTPDRFALHIYDMFGVDIVDGIDLFDHSFDLNVRRGLVYVPALMSNGQQQALMYTDLFRPAPKYGYQELPFNSTDNGDGTYTLSWTVPEGAKSYRIKAAEDKQIVDWLGYGKTSQQFAISDATNVPWFAALNLKNEPVPQAEGTVQTWVVSQLPNAGNWNFSVHYETQSEGPSAGNLPPTAIDDTATIATGSSVPIDVLANDSDPNAGDTLSVLSVTAPNNGVAVNSGNGIVTYTPSLGFSGSDTFDYAVSDGNGGTDVGTVNVTVTPVAPGGLLLHYDFTNGSGVAVADQSGNSNGGTLFGFTDTAVGAGVYNASEGWVSGGGLSFLSDGPQNYVDTGLSLNALAGKDVTIEFVSNYTQAVFQVPTPAIASDVSSYNTANVFALGISSSQDGVYAQSPSAGGTGFSGNPWTSSGSSDQHHIVMTFDAATSVVELFVDGVSQGTEAQPGLNFNSSAHFRIGNTGWTNYEQWGGVITGVAISDVKLAPGSFILEAGTNSTPGDFDEDGDVDGFDFLEWQRGFSVTTNADDLTDWQDNYGDSATAVAALSTGPVTPLAVASVSAEEATVTAGPAFLLSLNQVSPRASQASADTVLAESFALYGEGSKETLRQYPPLGSSVDSERDSERLSDLLFSETEEEPEEDDDSFLHSLDLAIELLG